MKTPIYTITDPLIYSLFKGSLKSVSTNKQNQQNGCVT